MKAILLCAGYATRLYPLTIDRPKPLLSVGGKPLLNHIIERLEKIQGMEDICIVTNAKFKKHFAEWKESFRSSKAIKVLNDTSTTNENRLGAIQDLNLVIGEEKIQDDILMVAGDNLFSFGLDDFAAYARAKAPGITIGVVDVKSKEDAKRYGILEIDSEGKVLRFFEKPASPVSTLASTGLYFIPKEKIPRVREFLGDHRNPDAPGFFIQWLLGKDPLYGFSFSGIWYDIGDIASYESANKLFSK
ncbi:MAG TPA: nucleotidyltransferase family protein [Candidatus Omnitrophota bacterium]|nr:nucleotidyltransferase family protein [Candidatus Omnitrophota bacterium]